MIKALYTNRMCAQLNPEITTQWNYYDSMKYSTKRANYNDGKWKISCYFNGFVRCLMRLYGIWCNVVISESLSIFTIRGELSLFRFRVLWSRGRFISIGTLPMYLVPYNEANPCWISVVCENVDFAWALVGGVKFREFD